MAKFTNPLANIKIAAPCSADWNEMNGSERVRFCASCQLNVFNLSAMTKREAEKLIIETEGNLCVRFHRRADGTVLTQNCPTGLKALKRRVTQTAAILFSTVMGFCMGNLATGAFSFLAYPQISISNEDRLSADEKFQGVFEVFPVTKQEVGYIPDTGRYEMGGAPRSEYWRAKPVSNLTSKRKR